MQFSLDEFLGLRYRPGGAFKGARLPNGKNCLDGSLEEKETRGV